MQLSEKFQQLKDVMMAGFRLASAHLEVWADNRLLQPFGKVYRTGSVGDVPYEIRSAVIETSPKQYQLFQVTRELQILSVFSVEPTFGPSAQEFDWNITKKVPLCGDTRVYHSVGEAIAMRNLYDKEAPSVSRDASREVS